MRDGDVDGLWHLLERGQKYDRILLTANLCKLKYSSTEVPSLWVMYPGWVQSSCPCLCSQKISKPSVPSQCNVPVVGCRRVLPRRIYSITW